MLNNKITGCALLITGTTIGAGMLGLPLSAIGLGYWASIGLMLFMWVMTIAAAFLILEANLADPLHLHFNTMASKTLGHLGQGAMTLSFLALLYALTVAYISGGSSLLSVGLKHFAGFELANLPSAIIFTLVLGFFIYTSTRATDLLNRGFMVVKFILLVLVAVLCIPQIDVVNLMENKTTAPSSLWLAIPVFFTAFGYHTIIPSLSQYANFNVSVLKRAIILGSGASLVIYLLWQTLSFGIIPPQDFTAQDQNSIGAFIELMGNLINKPSITLIINSFAHVALITSFLGVTLGLFDFLRDILPKNKMNTRFSVALLTFIPPLILALVSPQGFTQILAYAAAFLAVLACILPALMVYVLRKRMKQLPYQTPGGWFTPALVFLCGVIIIILVIGNL
ncbi:MAG: aromatic amino acid transport family protein [Legionellales bacterium]|jgi:tyrosine-specific transport protein